MIKFNIVIVFILLGTILLCSQETTEQDKLLKRTKENYSLVFTSPEEAFQESAIILQEAQREKNLEAELCAISTQCVYYESKNNFEKLMITAKLLFQKAETYQNPVYQTSAKIDIFNAYAFNGLYEQAFEELKQAERIIRRVEDKDFIIILTRVNLYVAFSNYYFLQKDYESQLKYLEKIADEYENLTDEKYKERFRYIDYSNRSRVYIDLNNLDSAKYFAELSLSKESGYGRNDIQFSNFLVLGRVSVEKGNYENAILYLLEAEKVKGYKNHLNLLTLYDNIIQAYKRLDEREKLNEYHAKRDSLKLNVSESRNESLLSLLEESGKDSISEHSIVLVFFLVLMAILMMVFIRKNKILTRQEKISQKYLEENPENERGENYSRLLEMLKINDQAFMAYFEKVYPTFIPKLLKLNPKIIQSDIEFCALLKLKIPTSDIARYKFITQKSVQNRKYLIRKKLNIPPDVDIYIWFSLF
ncbi:MAG: hypothetical protein M0Q41_03085 [Bacteroidales bacterium]|nr:hypothetical protein [Acholeplasmataceae bacterium]MCK9447943.1 hypothetical protein [Bacteroidales bacterium]